MTTQIAVRLPDGIVTFLDRLVAEGEAPSRAAIVTSAVERELRRRMALADLAVLRSQGSAHELDDLVRWSNAHPIELD